MTLKARFWAFSQVSYYPQKLESADMFGASLGVDFLQWGTVEAGAGANLVVTDSSVNAFLRAGIAAPIADTRQDGKTTPGWEVQVPAMAGYRFLIKMEETDGYDTGWYVHYATVVTGIEVTRWYSRNFGLNLRGTIGGAYAFTSKPRDDSGYESSDPAVFVVDMGLAVGFAF